MLSVGPGIRPQQAALPGCTAHIFTAEKNPLPQAYFSFLPRLLPPRGQSTQAKPPRNVQRVGKRDIRRGTECFELVVQRLQGRKKAGEVRRGDLRVYGRGEALI